MEFETVILRFRDLVTENNVTIARHKDMIDKKLLDPLVSSERIAPGVIIKEMRFYIECD